MKLLGRYVSRAVFAAIALVLLVLLSIDLVAAVVDGLGDIRNDYGFVDVLYHVGLTLPARIYNNIGFASLIGCLLGLGALAGNSELVVMRAAGVSLLRICGFVLRPVLFFIFLGVVLGEYLVPYTDQIAESRRMLLRGERENLSMSSGVWNREGREFIHFNAVYPNGRLFGVTRYRFDEQHRIEAVSFAARASYFGDYWVEEEGVVSRFIEDRIVTESFVTRHWDSSLSPDLLTLRVMAPESLSMRALFSYGGYLDAQSQKAGDYWLAFWTKALQPLAVVGLVLVATSFIFGPLRNATTGYRVFSGVIAGIVFQTAQELLGPSSIVFGFSAFWAVLLPILLCIGVGAGLLRRAA